MKTTKTKDELEAMKVSELKVHLRELKAGGGFAGTDSRLISQFVPYASKAQLVSAIVDDKLPDGYKPGAEQAEAAAPVATAAPAAAPGPGGFDPMAMFQAALTKAFQDGAANAKAEMLAANEELNRANGGLVLKLEQAEQERDTVTSRVTELETALAQAGSGGAGNNGAVVASGIPVAPRPEVKRGTVTAAQAMMVLDHGTPPRVPAKDPHFIFPAGSRETFDAALERTLQAKMPKGVRLVGHRGCGKSTLPEQWSQQHNRPFFKLNAGLLRDAKEWFGSKTVHDGSLMFILAQFATALETPNCTVCIDEINRAIAQSLNALMGVLDSGRTYIEELGREITVADGVIICATMNEGAEYSVINLDPALVDRFPYTVSCDYLPAADEVAVLMNKAGVPKDMAAKFQIMAQTIREKHANAVGMGGELHETMSTRQVIEAAWAFNKMGRDSLTSTVINRFSAVGGRDSERCKVEQIVQGLFG